jgi:hypothetical protein
LFDRRIEGVEVGVQDRGVLAHTNIRSHPGQNTGALVVKI